MKDYDDYEEVEVCQDTLPAQKSGNDIQSLGGNNQILNLADKAIDAINTYHEAKRDIIESVEKTTRRKYQLDAEVSVISADIERRKKENDNKHEERMKDMNEVGKLVNNAIETNDKEKFKIMADLFQAKFTGQVNSKNNSIDWDSNNNKLDF